MSCACESCRQGRGTDLAELLKSTYLGELEAWPSSNLVTPGHLLLTRGDGVGRG